MSQLKKKKYIGGTKRTPPPGGSFVKKSPVGKRVKYVFKSSCNYKFCHTSGHYQFHNKALNKITNFNKKKQRQPKQKNKITFSYSYYLFKLFYLFILPKLSLYTIII